MIAWSHNKLKSGFSNTEVEGCGAEGSFLLDSLSASIISSDDTVIVYSGDFNTAILREFLSSEEPLPAGAPNIYEMTFNAEGASANYQIRVISPTQFIETLTLTDGIVCNISIEFTRQ